MISRTPPLFTAAALLIIAAGSAFIAPGRDSAPPEPLSGILYSVNSDTETVRETTRRISEIDTARRPAQAGPKAANYFPAALKRPRRKNSPVKAVPAAPPAAISPAPVVAVVSTVSAASPPPSPSAAAPEPVSPPTFAEIDEALRASSTVQAINFRVKNNGITFRLTHVGRIGDRFVVRYAIANEETADFFLSIVNVYAGGQPIHSETAGAYSCPAGQEIFGIVDFDPAIAAGKTIVVELVQSGGDHRRFPLSPDYAF